MKNCINKEFINEYFSSLPLSAENQDLKLWTSSFASTTLFMFYDETISSMVSYVETKVRYLKINYNHISI